MVRTDSFEARIGILDLRFGYNIKSSLTSIQVGIGKGEISIRFDIIFIGIYIGLIW